MGGSGSGWKLGIFKVTEEDDGFLEGPGFSKLLACKSTLNINSKAKEIAETVKHLTCKREEMRSFSEYTFQKPGTGLGMVAHAFSPSTGEAKAGRPFLVQSQLDLHKASSKTARPT